MSALDAGWLVVWALLGVLFLVVCLGAYFQCKFGGPGPFGFVPPPNSWPAPPRALDPVQSDDETP